MMSQEWWRARRPWVCDHPSTAPAVLLAAKLLIIYPLGARMQRGFDAPFLPFVEWLAAPGVAMVWPWLLGGLFWSGAVLVLFNLVPRLGMALAGAALVLDALANRALFSNSELLLGVLPLVLALTEREDRERWWLRGQLALVYGGAALNKALSADWRNGRFFGHWAGEVLGLAWYSRLDATLEGGMSWLMGWFVIGLECVLAGLALRPAATRAWVFLGLGFHVGMLVFTGGMISWIFLFLMAVAFLALADERPGALFRMRPWWPYAAAGLLGLGQVLRRVLTT